MLATLHFDDDTTEKTRIPDDANKYYEHEPQGIGGLVGVAIPKNDAGTKLENLTVGENVTVAGLLVDDDTTATTDEPGEAGKRPAIPLWPPTRATRKRHPLAQCRRGRRVRTLCRAT